MASSKCVGCSKEIRDGERYYIEYPYDYYCEKCAKDRPDFDR